MFPQLGRSPHRAFLVGLLVGRRRLVGAKIQHVGIYWPIMPVRANYVAGRGKARYRGAGSSQFSQYAMSEACRSI